MNLNIELYPPEFFSEVCKKNTDEDSHLISIPNQKGNRSDFFVVMDWVDPPSGELQRTLHANL